MEPKIILIADDDFALTQAISMRFQAIGYIAMRSPDAMHALYGVQKINPDLIIMDVNMPGGNGMAVCEMLASDPRHANIPMIIHTGSSDEQLKQRCKDLGAHYLLKSPSAWDDLNHLVSSLIGESPAQAATSHEETVEYSASKTEEPLAKEPLIEEPLIEEPLTEEPLIEEPLAEEPLTEEPLIEEPLAEEHQAEETVSADLFDMPKSDISEGDSLADPVGDDSDPSSEGDETKLPKLLCIDDDPEISKTLMIQLRARGIDVHRAFDGMQGFWTALDIQPDVIILDMRMPDGEGGYVYGRLQDHSLLRNVPVIVLTGADNPATQRIMLAMGVSAYLKKPLVLDELMLELKKHITLTEYSRPPTATTQV